MRWRWSSIGLNVLSMAASVRLGNGVPNPGAWGLPILSPGLLTTPSRAPNRLANVGDPMSCKGGDWARPSRFREMGSDGRTSRTLLDRWRSWPSWSSSTMADDEDNDAQDADDEPSCSLPHCSSMDDRLQAECWLGV